MLTGKKNLFYSILYTLGFVLLLLGCKGKTKDDNIIKELENSLDRSNYTINISSLTILKSLENKTTDWATKERAEIWYFNAKQLDNFSSSIYDYLERLKKTTKVNSEKAKELASYLLKFKKDVLNIDSAIFLEFAKDFPVSLDTNNFYSNYFKNSSPLLTSSILTKIQNDVSVAKNKIIAFCHSKVGDTGWQHFWYSAIVGQNSTNVKGGEKIEITAGVGAYSKSSSPIININGKDILVGDEGFAKYTTKVSKTPGKYKIPVLIEFTDPSIGKKESQRVIVEYTVTKPCN